MHVLNIHINVCVYRESTFVYVYSFSMDYNQTSS